MHKTKKEKKVIQKTEETQIPTVFFYIDGKISKLIFEPDLDKLKKSFNVEINEEKGKHTKYTITSNDIKNCRKCCSVLLFFCSLPGGWLCVGLVVVSCWWVC